ncbi:hypothetical protein ACFL2A_02695 [Thermodesulfobacteriota bacterium]
MKCGYDKCTKKRAEGKDSAVMDQGIMRNGIWYCSLAHYEEQTRVDWSKKSKVDMKRKCRNLSCSNMRPVHFWDKLKSGEGMMKDGFWFCSPKCYEEDIKRKWTDERQQYIMQNKEGRIHKIKFGALLMQEGAITPEQLEGALLRSKKTKKRIGESLLELGEITEEALTKILSKQEGIPKIDLSRTTLKPEVTNLINKSQAKKYKALPIEILKKTNTLIIAISDPSDKLSLIDLKYITGYSVEPYIVPESALKSALMRYYDLQESDFDQLTVVEAKAKKAATPKAEAETTVARDDVLELKNAVNVILASIKEKGAMDFKVYLDEDAVKGSFDYGNISCIIEFRKK